MSVRPFLFSLLTSMGALPAAEERHPPIAPPVTALAFAPGGLEVVAGSQAGIEVRSWPALEPERRVETSLEHVHDLAFDPAGERLCAGGGSPATRGAIELFAWPGGERLAAIGCGDDVVHAVAWSPDGRVFAAAQHDGTVSVHDPEGDEPVLRLDGHSRPALAVVFIDGATLVSAGADRSLRVWDVPGGRTLRVLENHTEAVHDLAVRPAGREDGAPALVASVGADRTLRFWQPAIGRLVRFARLDSAPLSVAWTAGGDLAVAACSDGRLRAVDPETVDVVAGARAGEGWVFEVAPGPGARELAAGGEGGRVARVLLAGGAAKDE